MKRKSNYNQCQEDKCYEYAPFHSHFGRQRQHCNHHHQLKRNQLFEEDVLDIQLQGDSKMLFIAELLMVVLS